MQMLEMRVRVKKGDLVIEAEVRVMQHELRNKGNFSKLKR